MGEKFGLLISIFILCVFFIPGGLDLSVQNIRTSQLLGVTTEMQKLVDEEGGVTSRVLDVSSDLEKSGLEVSFTDENGTPISGKQDVGKYVYIHYNYNYDGFTKDNHLETSNYVLISRR